MVTSATPLIIVFNCRSGNRDAAAAEAAVRAVLAQAGQPYEFMRVERPRHLPALAQRAVARAHQVHGIVVVAGGDGTINTVVQAAHPSGCPVGILPQGTFNYVSRTYGIPLDPTAATRALLDAAVRPVQVGLINDRVFLVNASLGFYPQVLEDREAYKQQFGRHRLVALVAGMATLLRTYRPLLLLLEQAEERQALRTLTLVVGNNPLQLAQLGLPEAQAVQQGQLAAIAIRPASMLTMLGLLLRAACGRLGTAEPVVRFTFERLTVRPPGRRRLKVALDGEVTSLSTPLVFQVAPTPLSLLVPVRDTSATPAEAPVESL
ncbi:MAG: diacylglycerol kinase family protein [Candidatus Tectimicrobiota bacterium]